MIQIDDLLKHMVEEGASDGFISVGIKPYIKVNGQMRTFEKVNKPLRGKEVNELVQSAMDANQRASFNKTRECNFAIARPGIGRFRASAFVQRGMPGMVLRRIETDIPTIEQLGLPPVIAELAMKKRGLVIMVGGTGVGKSSSLAAMIGHRNRNTQGHIVCIEDPIEFIHKHDGCIVTQREVGMDTASFDVALRNTLRQAPDVIMIGEVRCAETMAQALAFAETGHLCLCTLHANNANQALDRIQSFFPAQQHSQVWMDLSLNLRAMVAQQLVSNKTQDGRVPVVEIMLNTPLVADYIRKGEVHNIKELMTRSTEQGMLTMDQSLLKHYKEGRIAAEEALRHADAPNDMRLAIKMYGKGEGSEDSSQELTYDQEDIAGQHHR